MPLGDCNPITKMFSYISSYCFSPPVDLVPTYGSLHKVEKLASGNPKPKFSYLLTI